jgi:hypothetical protein
MDVSNLQPHQQRVVEERNELIEKVTKLHAFTKTETFNSLPDEEQSLLFKQEKEMKKYADILKQRIDVFEGLSQNRELTFGEKAVGVSFNPSKNPAVDEAKELSARLIDLVEELSNKVDQNTSGRSWMFNVLRTQAINLLIGAQMAVVKFLTWND